MALIALAASLTATIIPTLIYISALKWFERYEHEPRTLVLTVFIWGAIPAALFSLVIEILADIPLALLNDSLAAMVSASAVAPIVEEIAKGMILLVLYLFFQREFNDPIAGMLYGALVGYGFALNENLGYFLSAWANGGWGAWSAVVFFREIIFGMNHALFTSLTGLGLGLARIATPRLARIIFALFGIALAIFFHAIHNLGAMLTDSSYVTLWISFLSDWGGIAIVGGVMWLGKQLEKNWVTQELAEEVATGFITPREYVLAQSYRARLRAKLGARFKGERQTVRNIDRITPALIELAFKKYQTRVRGTDNTRGIRALRQEITGIHAGWSH